MPQARRIAVAMDIVMPFDHHQLVFSGIMRYANEHPGWQCIIDEHPGYRARQRRHRGAGYDGVIARADARMQQRLKRMGIPLVTTHYQNHKPGTAGVFIDQQLAGQLAAEHLVNRGYRRLAALYFPGYKLFAKAFHAFMDHANEMGATCTADQAIHVDTSEPDACLDLEQHLDNWLAGLELPIALFVDSHLLARMIVEFCVNMGLHVPQDVAVLCSRESRTLLEIPKSISSIDLNYQQIGYEAAATLDRMMDGEPVPDEPLFVPPKGIIARASTDHFAVEDPLVAEALRRISSNLAGDLRLDDLAYELSVSSRTVQNRFKKALGRTIGAEIRRLRLSAAKVMLAEPEMPIDTIAKRVGYESADVLGHVFRREFGITPHAYRQQLANKD